MMRFQSCFLFFFFNDTATTEIYTLSLHDALPICLYLEKHLEVHRLPGALAFFQDQTEQYRRILAGSERRVGAFGDENQIKIGKANILNPVTAPFPMHASTWKKKNKTVYSRPSSKA